MGIVDDVARDREQLHAYLSRYGRERSLDIRVSEFEDGEDVVSDYQGDYDLILMDIELVFMNGMKAAVAIREKDEVVPIIFVTRSPDYAIAGYKVRALDYLLKPITYEAFRESLDRALALVRRREEKYIAIAQKGGKQRLLVSRICYVEVRDHLLFYHTAEGTYEAKGTMREAEEALAGGDFFRCNRCYLINLRFVEKYLSGEGEVLVNGDRVQVSRSRKRAFLDALNGYLNGGRV